MQSDMTVKILVHVLDVQSLFYVNFEFTYFY